MKLRGKLAIYLLIVIVSAVLLFVAPAVSGTSWTNMLGQLFAEYSEAVEAAQSDDDDDDEHDDDDEAASINMMVELDDEAEGFAGIETSQLAEYHYFAEIKAQAKVLAVTDLLALRSQYNQARAALNLAKVAESSSAKELARLTKLTQGTSSVAAKKVNYAEAHWREQKAKLQGAQFNLQDVKDQTRQKWGETIAKWIVTPNSKQFERLLSRQDSLLFVTLPIDHSLAAEVSFIRVSRNGDRDNARKAYFVSPAMSSDQLIQGETYYFRAATGKLRTGMRLDSWIPKDNELLTGVFIPDEAVVWYAGQAWVYVELEEGQYQRRSIKHGLDVAGGMFVDQEIVIGDSLVLSGSQMLLSEEFRWQIQDEDDD